jgi:hypothetical protein
MEEVAQEDLHAPQENQRAEERRDYTHLESNGESKEVFEPPYPEQYGTKDGGGHDDRGNNGIE